ncbi:hypothetical protein HDU97_002472 [Phlyctochytrium planicorne]|nr:hypothetical protein HDU97_002472 [Phlyctochytrium planicorne]
MHLNHILTVTASTLVTLLCISANAETNVSLASVNNSNIVHSNVALVSNANPLQERSLMSSSSVTSDQPSTHANKRKNSKNPSKKRNKQKNKKTNKKKKKKKSKNPKLQKKTSCPFVRKGGKGGSSKGHPKPAPRRSHLVRRNGDSCGEVLWAHNIYISKDIYVGKFGTCLEYHPGTSEGCVDLVQGFVDEVTAALNHLNGFPSFQALAQHMTKKVVIRGVVFSEFVAEAVPGDSYGVAHSNKCLFNKNEVGGFPIAGGSGSSVFLSVGFSTHCKAETNTKNRKTGKSVIKDNIKPYITLGHELVHAARTAHGHGPDFGMDKVTVQKKGFNNEEFLTVGGGDPIPFDGAQSLVGATENSLRHDAGENYRSDYNTFEAHCAPDPKHAFEFSNVRSRALADGSAPCVVGVHIKILCLLAELKRKTKKNYGHLRDYSSSTKMHLSHILAASASALITLLCASSNTNAETTAVNAIVNANLTSANTDLVQHALVDIPALNLQQRSLMSSSSAVSTDPSPPTLRPTKRRRKRGKRTNKKKKKKSKNPKLQKKTSCPFIRKGGSRGPKKPAPRRPRLVRRNGDSCGEVPWGHNIYISKDIHVGKVVTHCPEYHPGVTDGCVDLVQGFVNDVTDALNQLAVLESFKALLQKMTKKVVIRGVVYHEFVAEAVPGDAFTVAHSNKCDLNAQKIGKFPISGGSGASVFLSVGFKSLCEARTNTKNKNTGKSVIKDIIEPYITLGHELVHAARIAHGLGPDFGVDKVTIQKKGFNNEEFSTVGGGDPIPVDGAQSLVGATENSLRRDANLNYRSDYNTFEAVCKPDPKHALCQ